MQNVADRGSTEPRCSRDLRKVTRGALFRFSDRFDCTKADYRIDSTTQENNLKKGEGKQEQGISAVTQTAN